jgi:hypothetical protein
MMMPRAAAIVAGGGRDVLPADVVTEIKHRRWAGADDRPRLYFFASLRAFRSQQ